MTPTGRLRLARRVVEQGWPLRRAAESAGVSVTTAQRWASRYRAEGPAGMVDRCSRPRRCPQQTATRIERRVIGLRITHRWGPARIAFHLRHQNLAPSTVHKILRRYHCPPLRWIDPITGTRLRAKPAPHRYQHEQPGDLVHVDIKKLGRIPDGGGHKMLGRAHGRRNKRGPSAPPGLGPVTPPPRRPWQPAPTASHSVRRSKRDCPPPRVIKVHR